MAKLSRVCPHCGQQGALDSAYCAHCGVSTATERNPQENAAHNSLNNRDLGAGLPMQLRKAALPLLAGAAGLVVRAGWRLLQSKTAREIALNAAHSAVQSRFQPQPSRGGAPTKEGTPSKSGFGHLQPKSNSLSAQSSKPVAARRSGRTIRISSRWAVGDANGVLRQGQSEHTIEIDD